MIYLRDLQFKDNPSLERRKSPIIQQILYDTAPAPFNLLSISSTDRGYLISHSADEDLNYIFKPDFVTNLYAHHLKAELIEDIRICRQIIVTEPPNHIFSKSESELTKEIQDKNNTEILSLVKFKSDKTLDKYFFITLASLETSKRITDKGSITLFDKQLKAEKPKSKTRSTHHRQGSSSKYYNLQGSFPNYSNHQGSSTNYYNHQGSSTNYSNHQGSSTNYSNRQGSFPNYSDHQGSSTDYYNRQGSFQYYSNQTLPLNNPADTSSNTSQGSFIKYSDQGRGKALSPSSTWGGQHSRYTRPPVDTRNPPPNWKILNKQSYHRSHYHQSTNGTPKTNPQTTSGPANLHSSNSTPKNDFDIKAFVEATSKISETISYGMENPKAYLNIVNEALSKQGLPTVFVSTKNLSDSRKLYHLNNSAKPPIPQLLIPPQSTPVQPPIPQSQSCKPASFRTHSPSVPISKSLSIPQSQSNVSYQPVSYGPINLLNLPMTHLSKLLALLIYQPFLPPSKNFNNSSITLSSPIQTRYIPL